MSLLLLAFALLPAESTDRLDSLSVGFLSRSWTAPIPDSLRSFGPAERAEVRRALEAQAIAETELGFEKKWAVDSFFRLRVVDDLLEHPLHGPDYADSAALVVAGMRENLPALLVYMAEQADVALRAADTVALNRELDAEAGKAADLPGLAGNPARAVQLILAGYEVADRYLNRAVQGVTASELELLLAAAPTLWGDEDDSSEHHLKGSLQREFGLNPDTSRKFDTDTVLPAIRRLDRRALALSGLSVALAANRARMLLAEPSNPTGTPVSAEGVSGNVLYFAETKWGLVVVGDTGRNVYDVECALVIDLGGDDRYCGRVGVGYRLTFPSGLGHPFGVCLDLSGDDVYGSGKTLFNLGAGLFGTGILIDVAGNDVYRSHHNSQGIALYGTGVLCDLGGNDFYEAGWYAQGAGFVGSGLLVDAAGDDNYRLFDYGQGFASVWGYGLQADHAGNDMYFAGGKYIHHPLLPNDYRSFAQGFAIGFRPDCSGGIGFLFDRAGNDFYNAEVFCQATSYWYSLGMLYDCAGQDHYNANQYSQGAGIHLSVGILIDRAGDDQYFSRLGPTQGEGHDLSVGWLIDGQGDDSYACSGGQGIGLTNSAAFFIDKQGHDNYMTTENMGQGSSNWARGFGGMGVFVDMDGTNDQYVKGSPGADNSIWTAGTYGTGISLKAKPKQTVPAEETTFTPDTSQAKRPVKDVFKDAALWEVGEVRNKVKRARKELLSMAGEAAAYIAKEKLSSKDGLELRAMEELAKAVPETLAPYLFHGVYDGNRYTRSNCIYLLGKTKPKGVIDSLLRYLKLPGIRPRSVISAFSDIGDAQVAGRITQYLQDPYEPTRIATATTLGKLKDPATARFLVAALDDKLFTVRSAAEQALVDFGDTALPAILDYDRPLTARAALHAARATGKLAAKLDTLEQRALRIRARKALLAYLDHPAASTRAVAVEAVGKLLDDPTREALRRRMNDEADKLVLGKYRAVLDAE